MTTAVAAVAELGHLFLDAPLDEAARREYTRLFLKPGGAPCPPWQSLYEGEDRRLMGPAHHSALAWFRAYGFEPVDAHEPADHAGLLLLFYSHLLDCGAREKDLEAYEKAHLLWMREFAQKLLAAEAAEPYRAAAHAILDFLG